MTRITKSVLDVYPEAAGEAMRICLAEYRYWLEVEGSEEVEVQSMGALGAAANILGAIGGHRAPWHPEWRDPREQAWEDGGGI